MNKTLFPTKVTPKLVANRAGGKSYNLSSEQALAQYAVTCTFNGSYYADADKHLETVKGLLSEVNPELVAKIAVYAYENGGMKDLPAFILSYLFSIHEDVLFERVFKRVITNSKMLCNFVTFVRSGVHGRKSFGTLGQRLIQEWLTSRSAEQLFKDSVGHSNPSLVDIIKMTRPRFQDEAKNNVVRYLMGKEYSVELLPTLVQNFEALKAGRKASTEGLDFRLLSNLSLSTEQWTDLGIGMGWNALRMNLNNLQKHGVFNNPEMTAGFAAKLADPVLVKKFNAFPYQLMTTFQHIENVPQVLKDALEKALEAATENVPNLGRVATCVDVSGSMSSPATGTRKGATTKTRCVDVAGLVASCLFRTGSESIVIPFDTRVRIVPISKSDSVLTNAKKLAMNGGGTACSVALEHLVITQWRGDVVVMVSDNMSWADYASNNGGRDHFGRPTGGSASPFRDAWNKIKGNNPGCKLILLDITPNVQSQMCEDKNVLHVAGFSDQVFEVIKAFVDNKESFTSVIEKVQL